MTPSERLDIVTDHTTDSLDDRHINYQNDLDVTFDSIILTLGAFEQLLDELEGKFNNDQALALKKQLDWRSLPGPDAITTFSEFYFPQSIRVLTRFFSRLFGTREYKKSSLSV